jgi:hypothetical protein
MKVLLYLSLKLIEAIIWVRQVVAFIFSEENSLDFKQSVRDPFRFALYSCISRNHHSFSCLPLAGAVESFSKGIEVLLHL